MLGHTFSQDFFFYNIQSKPPLVQLEVVSACIVTYYLGDETDPHLPTTSFQVAVESNQVSPEPPLLQAKHPQFPQLLLTELVLQPLHQLRCPSLDTLQPLSACLIVRGPNWTQCTCFIFWGLALLSQCTLYMINNVKVNNNIFYYLFH